MTKTEAKEIVQAIQFIVIVSMAGIGIIIFAALMKLLVCELPAIWNWLINVPIIAYALAFIFVPMWIGALCIFFKYPYIR